MPAWFHQIGLMLLGGVFVWAGADHFRRFAEVSAMLRERGFSVRTEVPFAVHFHGQRIGEYRVDIVVDEKVILELKAGPTLVNGAKAQLLNYLRTSGLEIGLLLHFGPTAEVTRVISSRDSHR